MAVSEGASRGGFQRGVEYSLLNIFRGINDPNLFICMKMFKDFERHQKFSACFLERVVSRLDQLKIWLFVKKSDDKALPYHIVTLMF